MNVMAMLEADENGWVDHLLRDIARAPLLPDERGIGLPTPGSMNLTPAELRVVEAMSRGLTAEMAGDLFDVSPETVKTQLKAARYRLRGKNTTHAVANALRLGLIV
jgi:DNA-binding CsgD family transcriptional regulator